MQTSEGNFLDKVTKKLEDLSHTEFWKGHTGLAETIAEEELINHEVSRIMAANLDPSEFAHHCIANVRSGNMARASAYARVAGFQNWGDDFAKAFYEQFGQSFIDVMSETDRLTAETKSKTLDIVRRNVAHRSMEMIEAMASADGTVRYTKRTPEQLRLHPLYQKSVIKLKTAPGPDGTMVGADGKPVSERDQRHLLTELFVLSEAEKIKLEASSGAHGDAEIIDVVQQVTQDCKERVVDIAQRGKGDIHRVELEEFDAVNKNPTTIQGWAKAQTIMGGLDWKYSLKNMIAALRREVSRGARSVVEVRGIEVDVSNDKVLKEQLFDFGAIKELHAELKKKLYSAS
ncbi:hypothetical protein HZA86_05710 [Candidatus Uhrbacteria bacterium]|nr:hypothetical protein [Candidatus Uhrbacteria bacterium]